jgi:hypothetical protein
MAKQFAFLLLLSLPLAAVAQKFSGQWKGSFDESSSPARTEYVLEIEANGKTFEGVSITYFQIEGKRFYTICAVKGTIDPRSKTLVSKEVSKVKGNTPEWFQDCFQVHTLTYFKKGNEEQLVGTWKPAVKGTNCGNGTTVLSRKQLVKNPVTNPIASNDNRTAVQRQESKPNPKPQVPAKPVVPSKSNTRSNRLPAKKDTPVKQAPVIVRVENKTEEPKRTENKPLVAAPKLPNGLERRDNKVFETITLSSDEIEVSLYDNAEVDGDIITVLLNGEVVVSKEALSEKPITVKLKLIKGKDNTLTMYAENQGRVPPNTAIMRVRSGDEYFKIFLSADDKKNGSVIFRIR